MDCAVIRIQPVSSTVARARGTDDFDQASTWAQPGRSSPAVYAISIKQPFVEQILRGIKTREYRSQPTRITGRVYPYASLKPRPETAEGRKLGVPVGELPCGLVVGTVEIVKCVGVPNGGFAYVLAKPKRLAKRLTPRNHPQPCFWIPQF